MSLQEQVYGLDDIYNQFSIVVRSVGISPNEHQVDTVHLDVMKTGQLHEEISEQEKGDLKQAIYKAVGKSFPLEITSYVIPKEAEAVGEITEINAEDQLLLIKNLEWCKDKACEKYESFWVKPDKDIKINSEKQKGELRFDQLQIGDWIEVWTKGAVLQSLPPQIFALEILVKEEKVEPVVSLSSLLQTDFEHIDQIDIKYGDGKSLTLIDKKVIEQIAAKLKKIELMKARDQRTVLGFLYSMDLTIGDRKIRYSSGLRFDDLKYLRNPLTEELNNEIVRLGRGNISNLLPGIRF
ncbi:hypothetical protein ICC18_19480 [Paenibacillus sp. WST5]|uniref:Uncharacterized protein n=1 Tax=Paenibacillus sedimenti TaxID=2770274 RepID=A0A926QL81_9BACL|nr:hypothetical protein [Paenibacillus sedimenti]